MSLLIVCLIAAVVVILMLRRNMRFLSLIVTAEVSILVLMIASLALSAAGIGGGALKIFVSAMTTPVSLLGMNVSTLMLIQAVVVLMVIVGTIYMLTAIVKKVLKSKQDKDIFKNNCPEKLNIPRQDEARKVFKLYCRMNC